MANVYYQMEIEPAISVQASGLLGSQDLYLKTSERPAFSLLALFPAAKQ